MFTGSQHGYAKLGDDELLRLASDRTSLTDDAKLALESEMQRRNLTAVEVTNHAEFVRKNEQRENRRMRRKLFGSRRGVLNWVRFGFSVLLLMSAAALVALWLSAR